MSAQVHHHRCKWQVQPADSQGSLGKTRPRVAGGRRSRPTLPQPTRQQNSSFPPPPSSSSSSAPSFCLLFPLLLLLRCVLLNSCRLFASSFSASSASSASCLCPRPCPHACTSCSSSYCCAEASKIPQIFHNRPRGSPRPRQLRPSSAVYFLAKSAAPLGARPSSFRSRL